jgi:hypothetical protein
VASLATPCHTPVDFRPNELDKYHGQKKKTVEKAEKYLDFKFNWLVLILGKIFDVISLF